MSYSVLYRCRVYGTVTPFIGKLSLVDISSTFGRDETLTGRSEIWATLVPFAMKRPILGHGFGGFWTDARREIIAASHGHNGYLDAVDVERVNDYEEQMLAFFRSEHADILTEIRDSQKFDGDVKDRTVAALQAFAKQFA